MTDNVEAKDNGTPVYVIGDGDLHVGLHPEAPDMVLLAFPKQNMCLGLPLALAKSLHDGVCLAIEILEGVEEPTTGGASRPRMDN